MIKQRNHKRGAADLNYPAKTQWRKGYLVQIGYAKKPGLVNQARAAVGLTVLFVTAVSVLAGNAQLKPLPGHVPAAARRLPRKGTLPAETRLNLTIGIPLSDPAGLEDFLRRVSEPSDPEYRQYLTPDQFAQRFGPSKEQYEKVVAFAERNHLKVMTGHASRLVLDVNGAVADIQRAFNVTLHTFRHPAEDRDFYAPDTEPAVDPELPIADIGGLNNYILPYPKSIQMSAVEARVVPKSGSGPSGTFRGNDFRTAYMPGVTLNGEGQILGLVQFDGFYASDITAYEAAAGLPNVPLQTVLLDGYNGIPTTGPNSGNGEVSLDIEMAISMAPGLSKIVVFEAGPTGSQNDILSSMVSRSEIKQFSCSWGWGGGPSTTTDNLFRQMAAQGQSFFSASGDSDAFANGAVDDPSQSNTPSDCPYITVVGGTTLNTTGAGGAWAGEAVWNRSDGIGSSGGVSSHYSLPSWQASLDLAAAGGSRVYRNTPDVALVAENVFVQYGNGTNGAFGGTSCAAPLWGAIAALINQQAVSLGKSTIGLINPAIYELGKGTGYTGSFHDVTSGNNTWSGSPNSFYAVAGYDLCTGWGTPTGQSLVDALAGPRDDLGVAPVSGLNYTGPQGGPFGFSETQLQLTNRGSTAIEWSLMNTSAWLVVSQESGTVPPHGMGTVEVYLNEIADGLPEGSYSSSLIVSNQISHIAHIAASSLQVGQSIVKNGGFETGDFTDWILSGRSIVNSAGDGPTVYNAVEPNSSAYQVAYSGSFGAFLGDTQLATLSQILSTVPGQSYLISLWLDNPTIGPGQRFELNWITAPGSTNTVFSVNAPAILSWTNVQFIVTATGASTTLQLGAENDSAGFGVDDVSVKPLPSVAFEAIANSGTNWIVKWRGASGLRYQVQYATDLSGHSWINLGDPITGAGQSVSLTDPDPVGANGQRFYRLVATE
ncbi:MAG TPA: protease pro-enzyme activation domain-containing protein [Patescibacteria group bacterium]|nr:protease pro-enzyme activation domain-containing protein [Patescibacteria group bacterium]